MKNPLHNTLRLFMAFILLATAYFLPVLWAARTTEKMTPMKEQREEKEAQEKKRKLQKTVGKNRIVIDPGHGGKDPGMVGIDGVEEKQINLELALILGRLLENQGFEIIYTRTTDMGLYDEDGDNKKAQDMRRRCELIEEKKPLLTVSIHQNSFTNPSVYGPQVFYFEQSEHGKELASIVQEQLNSRLEVEKPRTIKGNTNYYLLKRSKGTTILVECAFLSNPQEAEQIQTEAYQQAVAEAICEGILQYLETAENGKTEGAAREEM